VSLITSAPGGRGHPIYEKLETNSILTWLIAFICCERFRSYIRNSFCLFELSPFYWYRSMLELMEGRADLSAVFSVSILHVVRFLIVMEQCQIAVSTTSVRYGLETLVKLVFMMHKREN
jgi:hypothetical protein